MEPLGLEIRERVAAYSKGDIDVRAFRDWFITEAWNIDQRAAKDTALMAHRIDLALAEFEHGDWTEDELKQHLGQAVKYDPKSVPSMGVEFSSAAEILETRDVTLEFPAPEFVDIRFEEASASGGPH